MKKLTTKNIEVNAYEYLTQHFKGKYRIVRNFHQKVMMCQEKKMEPLIKAMMTYILNVNSGNKIYYYGRGTFVAYIPSIIRGKNILKKLDETNIPYSDPHIYDSEVEFKFKTADMDAVANLLKASSFGADITPYSLKNFPKADVSIPTDKMDEYKKIIADIQKEDLLTFSRFTQSFLSDVLAKKLGRRNKLFDYKSDMKKLMMARQTKEYIYTKNMWDEYLKYLEEKIKDLYKEKEK